MSAGGAALGRYHWPLPGCRVTVIDSSVDALAILHRRAQDAGVQRRVAGVQADAESLATVVTAGSADLVLCHQLLEEVDDPAGVAAAFTAAVRPGGYVSVLTAGRLGAVLGQTLAGRFAEARAMLSDPDGRFSATDPLRRRYDVAGIGRIAVRRRLDVESVTGVGVFPGWFPVPPARRSPAETRNWSNWSPRPLCTPCSGRSLPICTLLRATGRRSAGRAGQAVDLAASGRPVSGAGRDVDGVQVTGGTP